MLRATGRGHGQDVVVQVAGLSKAPLVDGDDPDPVHGHGLHALHGEGGAGDAVGVATLPLWALPWPDLKDLPGEQDEAKAFYVEIRPGEVLGVGPGQRQGGVGGVGHLQVDDLTGRLWKRAVMCCGAQQFRRCIITSP